ncbi:hypothetical protein BLOT_008990 [Blomia tropicalis]|nr:hypothetical protein BLOT_008990 [Blomia tropicalis]
MKSYLTIALFAMLALAVYGAAVEECKGENEEFSSCGSYCPLTCLNKNLLLPCVKMCKVGCFCKQGFVRLGFDVQGGNGQCIEQTKCDQAIRDVTRHD